MHFELEPGKTERGKVKLTADEFAVTYNASLRKLIKLALNSDVPSEDDRISVNIADHILSKPSRQIENITILGSTNSFRLLSELVLDFAIATTSEESALATQLSCDLSTASQVLAVNKNHDGLTYQDDEIDAIIRNIQIPDSPEELA